MRRIGLPFLALAVLLALLLAACQPVTPEASEPAAAASEEGVVVTDALGRDVAFSQLPERVVVAGKGTYMVTGALFAFEEAKDRLAAFEGGRYNDPANFIPLIDAKFGDIAVLERNAGPEQIAPVKPDAIVL